MASLAQINVKFAADLKQFSTQMQNATRQVEKVGKKMTKVGKNLSVGLTAPIIALGAASVIAFDKQAKAIAQVEAGLKSTGGTAGKTSEELQKLASSLQGNSLFGDEEILKDVTAQLLTFTNIAGNQFDRTQLAALDLATRLDGDLKSASIQLGKALNDPVANLSALSRSGIQFSTDQKKVISALTKSGRLAEAQTIILDELEKQYGGAAEAAAKAGLGPFKQLSNSIGDLTEDFGKIITEALIPFIDYIKGVVDRFKDLDNSTKRIIVIVAALLAAIGPLLIAIGLLATTVIPGLIAAFKALSLVIASNPIGLAVIAITALSVAIAAASGVFREYTDAAMEFNDITKAATGNIAKEKVAIDKLVLTAINEKVSKEERSTALKKLQEQYPAYFKNLSIEKSTTNDITTATKKLTQALLQKAKVQAAEEKLVDVQKRLLDVQLKQADNIQPTLTDTYASAGSGLAKVFTGAYDRVVSGQDLFSGVALDFLTGSLDKRAKVISDNAAKETSELKKLQDQLLKFISSNQGVVESLKPVAPKVEEVTQSVEDLETTAKKFNVTGIQIQAPEFKPGADVELIPPEAVDQFDEDLLRMKERAFEFQEAITPIMENVVESFASGFGQLIANTAQGGNFLQGLFQLMSTVIGNVLVSLGKAAIGLGTTVEAMQKSLAAFVGTPSIIAGVALIALGTIIKSVVAGIGSGAGGGATPFANGGIVSGPVNALVGEYAGAKNNPEVIAPLSKLKAMLNDTGGGTSVIEGEFVLRGNDLVRVIRRQEKRDTRTT